MTMGGRFRKNVKITKGVKVNISKSGASLSLGGRGHSWNVSSRGIRTTVGMPGTGLSYSALSSNKDANRNRAQSATRSNKTVQLPKQVSLWMNDRGQIIIEDEKGTEITDKAVLRKIKALPQFQAQISTLEENRRARIDKKIQEAQEENERFINIYLLSPSADSVEQFEKRLLEIKPVAFVSKPFYKNQPSKERIRASLEREAEEKVKGLFRVKKLRDEYVEDNLPERYSEAISSWTKEKNEFEQKQEEARTVFEQAALEECESQQAFFKALIQGEDDAVCDVFDSWIATCELPVEINIDYDWDQQSGIMLLDVDLPEIEDLPTTKLVKTDSGNIKEKKKTQTELRGEYSNLVFGLAVFISANVFNISPAIQKVLISGYTQREDKEGNINDVYLYSIKFERSMFEQLDATSITPKEFCVLAKHRCNITTTSLLRAIVPYENYDEE